jgi:hypothetical protein
MLNLPFIETLSLLDSRLVPENYTGTNRRQAASLLDAPNVLVMIKATDFSACAYSESGL